MKQENIPTQGRVAGIDYGTVRIGIAITDVERKIASPLENYNRRTLGRDAEYFAQLAREETISLFVVGLPLYPSGDESPKSLEARQFGQWLQDVTQKPILFYDERYTSKFADELMRTASLSSKKRKARRDKLAAWVLLTSWLETSPSRKEDTTKSLE